MLKLNLRSKRFGPSEILRDVKIDLAAGGRIAILGPSGIGKSTLLRLIAGLDKTFEGELQAPSKIGLMFQSPNLLPWRTVGENLKIFHPLADSDHALSSVGLEGKAQLYPAQLSLGQQRRLALARTFMGAHELVLLDEPFASLDDQLREEMLTLTDQLLENSALILVTHSLAEAERLGCRVMYLSY